MRVFIGSLSVKRITDRSLKAIDPRYFRKFINFRASLRVHRREVFIIIFNIDFCILLDIRKFKNGNRSFLELLYCIKWKEGLEL